MKSIFFHFLIVAFAATTVFAQDTIVFKNGDTLSGTILKQDRLHVHFKSPAFGAVSLSTRDIREIRMKSPELGEVTMPIDAPPPVAKAVKKNPAPVAVPPPAAPAAPKVAAKAPVAPKPKPVPKPKKKRWTGQTGLEVAMREKNTTRLSNGNIIERTESYETYRVYGHVNWKGEKNNLRWNWTYRYSKDETRVRDDFFNVTQRYNHSFPKGFYYAEAKTLYQRDYNRQIDNEYLQTAELGRKWFDRPKFSLSTSLGGGYHQFDRIVAGSAVTTQEPKFIIDQAIRWQMINSLTLFQKYTHLGDLEKYHFVFTAGLENKLIRDVFLRLEYRLDRDTEVRYDDKGYYDKALRTSLLYKF
jgi:hypothetical protein